MVRGFKLIALNTLGAEEIKRLDAKDKGATVTVVSNNPFTLVFLFSDRVKKFIPRKSVEFFIADYFQDRIILDEDYRVEILE